MTTEKDDPQARLRRSVYLLMILVGTGAMLGRILAVDSVDRRALQTYLVNEIPELLLQKERDLLNKGVEPERVKRALAESEEKLRQRARLMRPFLSGNDRSRWCTVRALVEEDMRVEGHPYAIDKVTQEPTWDTIDMVKHGGHLYSSKPPLLPTLIAAEYWVIHRLTGIAGGEPMTLGTNPYWVGRFMLTTINVIPLLIYFLLLARLVERFGTSDWGRLFVTAAAVFGTFLTTFAVTINNHLPAAVSAMVTLYAAVRIWVDGERRLRYFALAGLFAAFTVTNELPALALFAALSAALLWKAPRQTILAYLPAALVVLAAFFATNWLAHGSLKPPYLHRKPIALAPVAEDFKLSVAVILFEGALAEDETEASETLVQAVLGALGQDAIRQAVVQSGWEQTGKAIEEAAGAATGRPLGEAARRAVTDAVQEADKTADRPDNWYDYAFERNGRFGESYWRDPQGIDRTDDSPAVYALHVLVGHHGIFSLTPVWLLSVVGVIIWLCNRRQRHLRELALLIAAVTVVCLAFYLYPRQFQRNYGGVVSGFRWMFWFAPLWLTVMLPAADAMARRWWTRLIALLTLVVSALSASYPTWSPWTLPWIMDYMQYLQGIG
ncbi:MAG: hypothetical protein ACYSWU_14760 [Planctomycetota bacterium]|jgi:hypothetical protein